MLVFGGVGFLMGGLVFFVWLEVFFDTNIVTNYQLLTLFIDIIGEKIFYLTSEDDSCTGKAES